MNQRTVWLGAALWLVVCGPAAADVTFDSSLFSNGMVLQRGVTVPIWGLAAPGERVTVTFAGQLKTTTATTRGTWRVDLDPLIAVGPAPLTILANNAILLRDVQVGEVWLCGGQSNMALALPSAVERAVNPAVRAFRFHDWSDAPGDICWDFALEINEALSVPVGILNNARGGAKIRSFLPGSVLGDPDPKVRTRVSAYPVWGRNWDTATEGLVPYAIRGVIWWQGESDIRTRAFDHHYILPALIRGWRREWGIGNFPFLFVQLPNGKGLPFGEEVQGLPDRPPANPAPAAMRQAFVTALAEPNTAMVVTSDLAGGTHPPKKVRPEYARRLADAARVHVYGESFVYSGPVIDLATAEGSGVRVRFLPDTAVGLHAGGGPLQGFALTADREDWVWATARIDGEEVVVSSPEIVAPVAVRYGYGRTFKWANLYNVRNLIAAPFEAGVQALP